jgi:hypothetical protein
LQNPDGSPTAGAQVIAISQRRGVVAASAISEKDGSFHIAGLEPGAYFLMAEPFFAGERVLPAYYSFVGSAPAGVCEGKPFPRQWARSEDESGRSSLREFEVSGGQSVSAGAWRLNCTEDFRSRFNDRATIDRFNDATKVRFYPLKGLHGDFEASALGFSLYSPVKLSLRLLNEAGIEVRSERFEPVFQGDSGFNNYDARLVASGLPWGDYLLEVSGARAPVTLFPGGMVSLDTVPFFLLSTSRNEPPPPLAAEIPMNARCTPDEVFPPYTSPPGNPPRRAVLGDLHRESGGLCAPAWAGVGPDSDSDSDSEVEADSRKASGQGRKQAWIVTGFWIGLALLVGRRFRV